MQRYIIVLFIRLELFVTEIYKFYLENVKWYIVSQPKEIGYA
jgi:hypothetical protein